MKIHLVLGSICLTVFLTACGPDLQAVREFADEASSLKGYRDLTERYGRSAAEALPYTFGQEQTLAVKNDSLRRADYQALLKLHDCVTLYYKTMAHLASLDPKETVSGIDDLAGRVGNIPSLGLDSTKVAAYASIVKIMGRWAVAEKQERAIKNLIREGNAPVLALLNAMSVIIDHYEAVDSLEHHSIMTYLNSLIMIAEKNNHLLATLARKDQSFMAASYSDARPRYNQAREEIRRLIDGQQLMAGSIEKFSDKEAKKKIQSLVEDIKKLKFAYTTLGR
jgi:hypothetical protein